jgi:AcrR family transcriptional regulator
MRSIATRDDIDDIILDTADLMLARWGYKKMTMDELAQEVGIGKGTIYLHFPSKEELVLSHIDRIVRRLKGKLTAIANSEKPPADRIREMLLTRVLFRFDSVQHYTGSLSELLSAIRPSLLARRERHFEEEAQIFADVIKEGRRLGALEADDAAGAARAMILATNSLLPYNLSTAELGKRKEIEKKAGQIADLVLMGLVRRK